MDNMNLKSYFQIIPIEQMWHEAVEKAVEPLINNKYVEIEYKHAIFANLKRSGSKFIISPYIILPHARPEQGVNQNAISVLLLKHPVYFDKSREPIKLIVILAMKDSVSHLKVLRKVAEILNKTGNITSILESTSAEALEEKFA